MASFMSAIWYSGLAAALRKAEVAEWGVVLVSRSQPYKYHVCLF